jgi:hypothetical protein
VYAAIFREARATIVPGRYLLCMVFSI